MEYALFLFIEISNSDGQHSEDDDGDEDRDISCSEDLGEHGTEELDPNCDGNAAQQKTVGSSQRGKPIVLA